MKLHNSQPEGTVPVTGYMPWAGRGNGGVGLPAVPD